MSLGSESNFFFGAAGAGTGYEIERSVRFNEGDSAYLSRTFASGNQKTYTYSTWLKRSDVDTTRTVFFAAAPTSSNYVQFSFNTNKITLFFRYLAGTAYTLTTDAEFKDTSAWYNVVIAVDSTQAVDTDRVKIYVNGVNYSYTGTVFNQDTLTTVNSAVQHAISSYQPYSPGAYFNGYLADIYFIDGQALEHTRFGNFDDNGVWQPKAYSGAYGTNGFHLLDFANESVVGNDSSGNNNDWTANNITETITPTYASKATAAYNGTVTNYSANPYWIDITPTDAVLNYTASTDNMALVHDGSITTYVYWVGNLGGDGGVTRARFDLRSFGTISSVRIYAGFPTGYVNYEYRMLDSSKTEIPGTDGTFGAYGWYDMVITGDPEYFEISCLHTASTSTRHRTYAVEVNGTVLVNGYASDMDVLYDAPTNGTQEDTGAGGEVSGNYATWNSLAKGTSATLSNGNLDITCGSGVGTTIGTIAVSSGKWYWEVTYTAGTYAVIGVSRPGVSTTSYLGSTTDGWGYFDIDGNKYNGTSSAYGDSYSVGDTIGVALDLDAGTLTFYKNNTSQGIAFTGLTGPLTPGFGDAGGSAVPAINANFGQRTFVYSPPTGYKALCTANLPDPTIADGTTAMDVVTYTGDGSTQIISGLEFDPDLVWIKARDSSTSYHVWFDRVRGEHLVLRSENNVVEADYDPNGVSAFGTNSFSVTDDSTGGYSVNGPPGGTYSGNGTYVAWTWDAGTSTVSNTDGSITSTVRANPSAGFSIVSYTGTGTAGTVGHGLNAAPQMILVKNRDAAIDGRVYHVGTDAVNPRLYWLKLFASSGDGARQTAGAVWNDTEPTSTVFSLGTASNVNSNTQKFIAYCWTPVEGYSSFGSYTGNGSNDGPFVYTGFKPTFVMYKRTDNSGNWHVDDYQRDGYNFENKNLYPNLVDVESTGSFIDILSNGFKLRTTSLPRNALNGTYVYAAFAENPFKTARAR